jgi:hypothetical protein
MHMQGSGAVGADYGQTREHAQLARSLGVEQLAVVISKLDLAGYDQVRKLITTTTTSNSYSKACCFITTRTISRMARGFMVCHLLPGSMQVIALKERVITMKRLF